jgi:lipoate---protein ligase
LTDVSWEPGARIGEPPPGWVVEVGRGPAALLHGREVHADVGHVAWFLDASGAALVLGSTQSDADVASDAEGRGIAVVRRRSGGGAVLVGDGDATWLDLVIPRGSPLWLDDVGRAMHWVGDLWASALGDLGVGATVHRGALQGSEWSRRICFAGVGPGEVLAEDGRKIVGVSQRRTRHAARFQTIAYHRAPWSATVASLAVDDGARHRALAALDGGAGVIDVAADGLRERLLAHLPTLS